MRLYPAFALTLLYQNHELLTNGIEKRNVGQTNLFLLFKELVHLHKAQLHGPRSRGLQVSKVPFESFFSKCESMKEVSKTVWWNSFLVY